MTVTKENLPDELIDDVITEGWGYVVRSYGLRALTTEEWDAIEAARNYGPDTIASAWIDEEGGEDELTIVTYDQVREAYGKFLDLTGERLVRRDIQDYIIASWMERDGATGLIDGGEIDSEAADCIMQVAAYGKIVYG